MPYNKNTALKSGELLKRPQKHCTKCCGGKNTASVFNKLNIKQVKNRAYIIQICISKYIYA